LLLNSVLGYVVVLQLLVSYWLGQSVRDLLLYKVSLLLRHVKKRVVLLILLQIETMFIQELLGHDYKLLDRFLGRLLLRYLMRVVSWILECLRELAAGAVVDLGLLDV
jgi:hypothetical protein